MSKVTVLQSTWIGTASGNLLLSGGEEYDSDHPLVKARPELFSKPVPEPKPSARRVRK